MRNIIIKAAAREAGIPAATHITALLLKKTDNIKKNNTQLSQITDIPMPEESIIDLEKTLIVGEKSDWMGRITLINKNTKV